MRAAQSLTFTATLRQRVTMTAVVVPFVFAGSVRAVAAQSTANSRAFVSVNGGYQVTSTDFSDKVVFPLFLEDGDFQADYKVEPGPVYDVSGGVRLWRNLAVGGGV